MSERRRNQQTSAAALEKKPIRKPTEKDFSAKSVSGKVLKDSVEHPATIYPFAGAALALGWTLIIAPSPISLGISFGLAFVGASSFIYSYVVKGPEKVVAHVAEMREMRRQWDVQRLEELISKCVQSSLPEAAKEGQELLFAYQELTRYFRESELRVSTDKFRQLADESFRQGISTIEQALATYKAMGAIDVFTLQREIDYWETQLKSADANSSRARLLKQQIESHQRRVDLHTNGMEKLHELLAESNEIESALQSTYVELVDLGNRNLDDFLREDSSASNRLRSAVEIARKVEERLRGGEDAELEARKSKYIGQQADSQQESDDPSQVSHSEQQETPS